MEVENEWYKRFVRTDSGWFVTTNKWNWTNEIKKYMIPYYFKDFNLDNRSFILKAKESLAKLTPASVTFKNGKIIPGLDPLSREGDTLFLYKYRGKDTIHVDMIWWSNAQRNQVFYHE